eukprot:m.136398 g.136398  ORF g.136398 m.136398 type:complete len:626 (+) comp13994_c1_seq1:187-2064(+)
MKCVNAWQPSHTIFRWTVLFVGLALSCAEAPPNIIFILADDLGYGDVDIAPLRSPEATIVPTPNIRKLRENGMLFLRGYSGQVCAPSRCSLMTGRHSGHCTIRGNDGSYSPLLPSDTTVAEVLQEKYHTAILGKWGLGNFNTTGYPLVQGFDDFVGQDSQVACHNWYPYTIQNNTDGSYHLPSNQEASDSNCGEHHSKCKWLNDHINEAVSAYIANKSSSSKPFFLFFSTTTPHVGDLMGNSSSHPVPAPYDTLFPQWTKELALYAGAIAAQDMFVGAVLEALTANDIMNDTLVFFSGDNGPDDTNFKFWDDVGPFRGKKRSLHEGGVRQNIVAHWPGHIEPNSTSDHIFTFWDFLPTAADIAGIDLPPGIDGISAVPALLSKNGTQQQDHTYLYWEFCCYDQTTGILPNQYKGGWVQAVRFDDANATYMTEWKAIRVDSQPPTFLFNITGDMSESIDLSSSYPAVVQTATNFMDESHTANKWWPSSPNSTVKCCAACYNPQGCPAPCVGPAPPPPKCQHVAPVIPFNVLNGTWIQQSVEKFHYGMTVDKSSLTIQLSVDDCTDCCWETAYGTISADARTINVQGTTGSCNRTLTGEVCDDGNTLTIEWSQRWPSWQKPETVDLD